MPDRPNNEEPDWQQLRDLLPTLEATNPPQQYWTDEELFRGRQHWVRRFLKAGWRFAGGFMEHNGRGGTKIQSQVGFDPPISQPGDSTFNPRTDAWAIRMGARFVSDNWYYHDGRGVWMDRLGSLQLPPGPPLGRKRDGIQGIDWTCPECGDSPWHVKVDVTPPGASVRKYAFTYCRQCVTPVEVAEAKRRREAHGGKL